MGDDRKKRRREKEARKILKKLRKSAEKTTEPPSPRERETETPRRRMYGPARPTTLPRVPIGPELPEELQTAVEGDVEDTGELQGPEPPDDWGTETDAVTQGSNSEQVERILAILNKGVAFLDPYEILNLPPDAASDASVKKAYWRASLAVHPDKNAHPQAPKAFQALNQAWKDLRSSESRRTVEHRRESASEKRQIERALKEQKRREEWSHVLHPGQKRASMEPQGRQTWMTELPELKRRPQVMKQVHQTSFSRKEASSASRAAASHWTQMPDLKSRTTQPTPLPAEAPMAQSGVQRRGMSLMEQHQAKQKVSVKQKGCSTGKSGAGSFQYRPFDREKDLDLKRSKNGDLGSLMNGMGSLRDRFS